MQLHRPHQPRQPRRAARAIAGGLAVTALAASPAGAMPLIDPPLHPATSTPHAVTVALVASRADAKPSGVHVTPLSQGTIVPKGRAHSAGITIGTQGPRDMLVTSITVDPGGSFGWHSHPGPVLVALRRGTLTVYEAHYGRCARSTVTAGTAFVEDGAHVHLARNEGSTPVRLNAVFLARPGTTEFLRQEAAAKACHV